MAGDQTGSEAALRSAYTEFWDWRLQNNPEFASNIGDHRFDSLLEDYSPAYIDERKVKIVVAEVEVVELLVLTLSPPNLNMSFGTTFTFSIIVAFTNQRIQ